MLHVLRWLEASRKRLTKRSGRPGAGLYAMVGVILVVSWAVPPLALIGVPFSILLVILAILCIVTVVLMPLAIPLY